MVKIYENSYGKVPVPANMIPNETRKYMFCAKDIADININVGENPLGAVANECVILESQLTHIKNHVGEKMVIPMPEVKLDIKMFNKNKEGNYLPKKIYVEETINGKVVKTLKEFTTKDCGKKIKLADEIVEVTAERVEELRNLIDRAKNCMDLCIDNAKRVSMLDVVKESKDIMNSWAVLKTSDGHVIKGQIMNDIQKDAGIYVTELHDNIYRLRKIAKENIIIADKITKDEMIDIETLFNDLSSNLNSKQGKIKKEVIDVVRNADLKMKNLLRQIGESNDLDEKGELTTLLADMQKDLVKYLEDEKLYLNKNTTNALLRYAFDDRNEDIRPTLLKVLINKNKAGVKSAIVSNNSKEVIEKNTKEIIEELNYSRKATFELTKKVDETCKYINNSINSIFYENILYMTDKQREEYLLNKLNDEQIEKSMSKWNVNKSFVANMTVLDSIKYDIKLATDKLNKAELKLMDNLFRYEINRGFEKNIKKYNLKDKLSDDVVEKILKSRNFGMNYIERINKNNKTFNKLINKDLQKNLILKGEFDMKNIIDFLGENHTQAENRLLTTELASMYNNGVAEALKIVGYNKYIFISVMESNTCEKCQSLHNKIFDFDEAEVGVNFPYIHPHCHCTIRPYENV